MQKQYYSFEQGGWKFIMLDSMTRREGGFLAALEPEEKEWLKGELQSAGTEKPIAIFSHIPLVAVCVFFTGKPAAEDGFHIAHHSMHVDVRELLDLLAPYNVKLLVSGHIHVVDRIEYRDMTFICDGSISGNWWRGPRLQSPEGYGVFDFHADGRFDHRYVAYGWKA